MSVGNRLFVILYVYVIVVTFAFSLGLSYYEAMNTVTFPLTEKGAYILSLNSPTIQKWLGWLNDSRMRDGFKPITYRPSIYYWNKEYIQNEKQKHPGLPDYENLPSDHGVWHVYWRRHEFGNIVQSIDELTGEILFERVHTHA